MKGKSVLYCIAILLLPLFGECQNATDNPHSRLANYAEIGWTLHRVSGIVNGEEFETKAIGPSTTLGLNWDNFNMRFSLCPLFPYSFEIGPYDSRYFTNGIIWSNSLAVGYTFSTHENSSFIPRIGIRQYSGTIHRINVTSVSQTLEFYTQSLIDLGLTMATYPAERIAVNVDLGYAVARGYSGLYFQLGVRIGKLTD